MPGKVRQLVADLVAAGWRLAPGAGKGSHRKFRHPRLRYVIILSGNDGHDAHRYQEKDVHQGVNDAQASTQNDDESR